VTVSRLELTFQWVLQSSWQAAVLIVFILGVQWIFRRQLGARWQAGLWLLVVIRLLLPFGPTASWSVFHHVSPRAAAAWVTRWIAPGGLAEPRPPGTPAEVATVPAEPGSSKSGSAAGQSRSHLAVLRWALDLWLLGVFALGARLGWQNGWLVWRLRKCRPVTDPDLLALLADCRQRVGVRATLSLVETDLVRSPALYGFGRWQLLWPAQVMAKLGREQRRYVLLHELAHLRRRDPWINWLLSLLRLVHWFNPLVWYAFRRLRRDRELACDELVLTLTLGEGKVAYGQTIIRLLELGMDAARNPALTGIAENREDLERRINMIAQFRLHTSQPLVAALLVAGLGLFTLTNGPSDVQAGQGPADATPKPGNAPLTPRIVATSPKVGATDVSPALTEISVTFDRDMGAGFSWTGSGPDHPLSPEGRKPQWRDKRTCVLPVKLVAGHYYRVGINSKSFQNFKSAEGVPAEPSAIYFTTPGAGNDVKSKTTKPQIVECTPPIGAQDVSSGLGELRVTFSVPMGRGFSWTGSGPEYPKVPEGKRPSWSDDGRTCILPVQLEPNHSYRLGLNSPSHKNFQSAGGIPLDPVVYTFKTKAK
jgi:beta-lactamase regulating signal transducer with metallopeptidase domain